MDSPALHVWSTVLVVTLVVITIWVSLCTVKTIATGEVFELENGWRRSRLEVLEGSKLS